MTSSKKILANGRDNDRITVLFSVMHFQSRPTCIYAMEVFLLLFVTVTDVLTADVKKKREYY